MAKVFGGIQYNHVVYYGNEVIGRLVGGVGMTDEEICEACGIRLAHTQEEYEGAPENGMYSLDDLVID